MLLFSLHDSTQLRMLRVIFLPPIPVPLKDDDDDDDDNDDDDDDD